MLEFSFVSFASTSFLNRAFSCCSSAMVIGLSPTLTERDGLAVDEGEPMDDSLEAGLKFGE